MDPEKIIFIILAILFSVISMFLKSKKQRQTSTEAESADTDFSYETEPVTVLNSKDFFLPFEIQDVQYNANIASKKEKKKSKQQNIDHKNSQIDTPQITSQDFDLENENDLLGGFEGTELQKAFLYSEVSKNTKN